MSSALSDPFADSKNVEATFSIASAPEWISKEEIPWQTQPGVDDHYIDLLVHTQWSPARFIRHERNVRLLISREAVQRLSQVELEWDPAIESLIVHEVALWRTGVKRSFAERARFMLRQREGDLEKHLVHGRMSAILLLDDVRMGDAVEVEYSIHSRARLEGEKFDAIYAIERPTITGSWMVSIRLPDDAPFEWRSTQSDLAMENVRDPHEGERVRTFRGQQQKKLEVDPGVPPWIIPQQHFRVTGYRSWSEVAEVIRQSWAQVALDENRLADAVREITADLTSAEDKAQALIHWVQEKVRYLGMVGGAGGLKPNPPHIVFERRYGDCKDKTLLLCSLLRIAGIEAWPFLVSTDRLKGIAQDLPGLGSFNHVITGLRLNGVACYVDGTTAGDGGSPATRCLPPYGFGLRVQAGVDALESMPWQAPDHTAILVTEDFHFHLKKPESWVDWRIEATGMDANRLRARLEAVGGEVFNKTEAEDLKQFFRDAKHHGPAEWQDDLMANRIIVWGRVLFGGWGTPAQLSQRQIQYRPRWLYNLFVLPARDEKRTQPFMIPRPSLVRHEMRMHHERHSFNSDVFLSTSSKWFRSATQIRRPTREMVLATYSMEWLTDTVEPAEVEAFWTKLEDTISNQLGLMLSMGWKGPAKIPIVEPTAPNVAIPEPASVTVPRIPLPVSDVSATWFQRQSMEGYGLLHTLKRWLWWPSTIRTAYCFIAVFAVGVYGGLRNVGEPQVPLAVSQLKSKPVGAQTISNSQYAAFDKAMSQGDYDLADSILSQIHRRTSYTASYARASARYFLLLGDFATAHERALDANRMEPRSLETLYLLSRLALLKDGDAAKAESIADELTTQSPESPVAWEAAAYAQSAQKRHSLAENAALKAVSLAPGDFNARLALLEVYAAQNDSAKALTVAQESAGLFPKSGHFAYQASMMHRDAGGTDQALSYAREAAAREPNHSLYLAHLAWMLALAKQQDEALTLADRASRSASDHQETHYALGMAYSLAGQPRKALIAFQKRVELERSPLTLNDLGYAFIQAEDYPKAIAELNHAIQLDPNCLLAWENLVQAHTKAGNPDKAAEAQVQVNRLK